MACGVPSFGVANPVNGQSRAVSARGICNKKPFADQRVICEGFEEGFPCLPTLLRKSVGPFAGCRKMAGRYLHQPASPITQP